MNNLRQVFDDLTTRGITEFFEQIRAKHKGEKRIELDTERIQNQLIEWLTTDGADLPKYFDKAPEKVELTRRLENVARHKMRPPEGDIRIEVAGIKITSWPVGEEKKAIGGS